METKNNGGSTDYYKLKKGWSDCMDIIEDKQYNYSEGNILKVAFTLDTGRHTGTNRIRDLNKLIYFANRLIDEELEKEADTIDLEKYYKENR